jgi:hypothetical protein
MLIKWFGAFVVASTVLTVGAVTHSFAQNAPSNFPGPTGGPVYAPTGGPGYAPAGSPSDAYREGVAAGPWYLFPSIFVGGVYDSNISQSAQGTPVESGWGVRTVPRLTATYDGGIHQTTFYGVFDGEYFPNTNVGASTLAATAGFSHRYEMWRDLIFSFYGNYTREKDIFNSALNFNNGAIGAPGTPSSNIPLIINPFGNTPGVNPIPFNQFTLGSGVTKTFGPGFAAVTATGYYIAYDQTQESVPPPFQTSLNGANVWVTGRVGYHVIPALYVFAEGDGIFQRFQNSVFDTNGFRVIGGVGSDDPNSLFRGEAYGGYAAQQEVNAGGAASGLPPGLGIPPENINSPVFGGRLAYYPTPYWTVVAQVDETLGVTTFLSPSVPAGAPSLVTTAILQTTYSISRDWSAGVRGGYTRAQFFGIDELQNGWLGGASFNYAIWRNLLLTLDYQYTTLHSNVAFGDFVNNQFTAGVTYKY